MIRPKYPKADENHSIPREFCEAVNYRYKGHTIWLADTSRIGGNLLDWIVGIAGAFFLVEIKQPGSEDNFTPGELYTVTYCQSTGAPCFVVSSAEEFQQALEVMCNV